MPWLLVAVLAFLLVIVWAQLWSQNALAREQGRRWTAKIRSIQTDLDAALASAAWQDSEIEVEPERACKRCGCTHFNPCEVEGGTFCAWVAPNLCSSCVTEEEMSALAKFLGA